MRDFSKEIELRKEKIVSDLQGWIRCGSVYDESTVAEGKPFGEGVYNALQYIASLAKEDGFTVDTCDGYCTEITYGDGEERVVVLGHADVVPVGKGWDYDPFGAEIKDGIMYGRGTSDDKGATLAAYYALKIIKDLNIPLKRKVVIVAGGNEESGSRCMDYYFNTLKRPQPTYGFTPDANFPLIYGEKGGYNYMYSGEYIDEDLESIDAGVVVNAVAQEANFVLKKTYDGLENRFNSFLKEFGLKGTYKEENSKTYLTLIGVAAHASTPWLGVNALAYGLKFLAEQNISLLAKHFSDKFVNYYGEGLGVNYESEPMGKLTMNIGLARYDGKAYKLIIDIRYPHDLKGEWITSRLDKHILHEGKCLRDSIPLYVDPTSPFIQTLLRVYQECTGDYERLPMTIGGGTYARSADNVVAFGMEFENGSGSGHIHDANEALCLEDLYKGIEIYCNTLIELGNM